MKKKSLVGWTTKGWQLCWFNFNPNLKTKKMLKMVNPVFVLDTPSIRNFKYPPGQIKEVKVRITIEEIK